MSLFLEHKSPLKLTKEAVVENKPIGDGGIRVYTDHPIDLVLNYNQDCDNFFLSFTGGVIPYEWQWEELKEAIDETYKELETKDVEEANQELEKETQERRKSSKKSKSNTNQQQTKKPGYVYLLKGESYYKIGKSKNPERRSNTLTVNLPFEVRLIHTVKSNQYGKLEEFLHSKFANKRTNGEWFKLDKKDIDYIKNLDGDEYA